MFNNKTILITGDTVSFGNAALHRFLHTEIKESSIFSCDEKKQDEMRNVFQNSKLKFYCGNVQNYDGIILDLQDVERMLFATSPSSG